MEATTSNIKVDTPLSKVGSPYSIRIQIQAKFMLIQAHLLDKQAETFENQGQFERAYEARTLASQQFTLASNQTSDPSARDTLDLLSTQQKHFANDLQRKVAHSKSRTVPPKPSHRPLPGPSRVKPEPNYRRTAEWNSNPASEL